MNDTSWIVRPRGMAGSRGCYRRVVRKLLSAGGASISVVVPNLRARSRCQHFFAMSIPCDLKSGELSVVHELAVPRADIALDSLLADYEQALTVLQELTTEFASRVRRLEDAVEIESSDDDHHRPPMVELLCLGPFEVRVNGQAIGVPAGGRPAAILKILADRGGRPTSREMLLEALWPEISPETGANRLRVAVHSLRQLNGGLHDLVAFEHGHYRLDGARVEIDAEQFEALVAAGRSLERADELDRALAVYHQAERLYRGDYFQDDPFEDWALLRRQHLRDLYLNLMVKLAVLALERDDYEGCISYCHEIVRQDNCSEDAYRLLMLAHAHQGNRARALRWYELCEQTLRRELEVEPSAPTRVLRLEILNEPVDDDRSLRQRLGLGAIGALGISIPALFSGSKAAVAAVVMLGSFIAIDAAEEPPPTPDVRISASSRIPDVRIVASAPATQPIAAATDVATPVASPPAPSQLVLPAPATVTAPTPAATSEDSDPPGPLVHQFAPPNSAAPPVQTQTPEATAPPEDLGSPAHAHAPKDAGLPEAPGPPAHAHALKDAGPPEDPGPPAHAHAPEDAGPPEAPGPPAHAHAPVDAGPPESVGPPEDIGPPAHAQASADTGPSESVGPPDDPGSPAGGHSRASLAVNTTPGSNTEPPSGPELPVMPPAPLAVERQSRR